MKKFAILIAIIIFFFVATPASAQTIDGTIGVGEWDSYFLGTSVTGWSGGMSVDVYGYADDTYLYAAYVADTTQPGWATAKALSFPGVNAYFKTPTTIVWPAAGYTIAENTQGYRQTDGAGWTPLSSYASGGIDAYIVVAATDADNVAEIKLPLSLITYAGDDGQIAVSGQYWQYDFATSFLIDLPDPTKANILMDSSIPGMGLETAPGLQKSFNSQSKAAENAGKK